LALDGPRRRWEIVAGGDNHGGRVNALSIGERHTIPARDLIERNGAIAIMNKFAFTLDARPLRHGIHYACDIATIEAAREIALDSGHLGFWPPQLSSVQLRPIEEVRWLFGPETHAASRNIQNLAVLRCAVGKTKAKPRALFDDVDIDLA